MIDGTLSLSHLPPLRYSLLPFLLSSFSHSLHCSPFLPLFFLHSQLGCLFGVKDESCYLDGDELWSIIKHQFPVHHSLEVLGLLGTLLTHQVLELLVLLELPGRVGREMMSRGREQEVGLNI